LKLLHVMDNDFGDTFPNEITLSLVLRSSSCQTTWIGNMLPPPNG
jgi:hypothetical protein